MKEKEINPSLHESRPHIYEIDLIRVITVFSVVAVHSLSFTSFLTKDIESAQLLHLIIHMLHFNREMFMFVTGLVLTYVYFHRNFSAKKFWLKRTLFVFIPYVLWSFIYTRINNPHLGTNDYISRALYETLTGDASFQLYYILLSLQFYAIFPFFLTFLKKVAHHPWITMGISLAIQLVFLYYNFHYIQTFANNNHPILKNISYYQDRVLIVYQFFFVFGSFAAIYMNEVRSFIKRHVKSAVLLFIGSLTLYTAYYFYQIGILDMPINLATSVLQPSVVLYSIFVILFLCILAILWDKKRYFYKLVNIISNSSFGIYFVHVFFLSVITKNLLPHTPDSIPVPVKDISVLLLAFSASTFVCYLLLKSPWLSWTIGKGQRLNLPKLSLKRSFVLAFEQTRRISKKISINHFILFIGILVMLGIGIVLSLNSSSQDTLRHALTHHQGHHNMQNTPTISLDYSPHQNPYQIINQQIQTTGCGVTLPVKAGVPTNIGIIIDNTQRMYRLYLPIHYVNTMQHALILNFHGYASDPEWQEHISKFDQLANTQGFIVVYPEGTMGNDGVRGWNTGLHSEITSNDVLFVSNLLNDIQRNLCVNPNQIYATGFSNGGGFVNELACTMSGRIAAFAPVSGSYVSSFKNCAVHKSVSLMEIHGTADGIVPYNGDNRTREFAVQSWTKRWVLHDNCYPKSSVAYRSKRVVEYSWTNCQDQASIITYKIMGGRHTWPVLRFKRSINGHNVYINAATLIWDFFDQHPFYSPSSTTT